MTREQAINSMISHGFKVEQVGEIIKAVTPQFSSELEKNSKKLEEPTSFQWCTDCKEYDQEKHCCHRWSKVIRDTVEEMKQEPKSEWEHDHEILKAYADGANEVLDKLRAEIEAEPYVSKMEVLDIIDKYKGEGSDKE